MAAGQRVPGVHRLYCTGLFLGRGAVDDARDAADTSVGAWCTRMASVPLRSR